MNGHVTPRWSEFPTSTLREEAARLTAFAESHPEHAPTARQLDAVMRALAERGETE